MSLKLDSSLDSFLINNFGKKNQSIDFDINQPAVVNEPEYVKVLLLKTIQDSASSFVGEPIEFHSPDAQELVKKKELNKFARNFAIQENLTENFLDASDILVEYLSSSRQTLNSNDAFRLIKTFIEFKNSWDIPCDLKKPNMRRVNNEVLPVSKADLKFFEQNADSGLAVEYVSALRGMAEFDYWKANGKTTRFIVVSDVLAASFSELSNKHIVYEKTKNRDWEIFKHLVRPSNFMSEENAVLAFIYKVGKINNEVLKKEMELDSPTQEKDTQFKIS